MITWWDVIQIRFARTVFAIRRLVSMFLPLLIFTIAASALYERVKDVFFLGPPRQPETFEERIATLTNSLNNAANQVSEIEQEITRRKQLAEQLQAQADQARKISTMNADQVNAVAQALRGELHDETKSEFWNSTLTNIFFAFLGAVFGEVFRYIRGWRRAKMSGGSDAT
jgi:hypothetical protein